MAADAAVIAKLDPSRPSATAVILRLVTTTIHQSNTSRPGPHLHTSAMNGGRKTRQAQLVWAAILATANYLRKRQPFSPLPRRIKPLFAFAVVFGDKSSGRLQCLRPDRNDVTMKVGGHTTSSGRPGPIALITRRGQASRDIFRRNENAPKVFPFCARLGSGGNTATRLGV